MSENKEESNSTSPDVKEEESSPKADESKSLDESSKDSEKDSVKEDSVKAESEKEESEKEESEKEESEDEDEEGMGLLDRPVEVTGCRARKKVERLEVSFTAPKEKHEIPEGKGQKLGDCPRIEHQIQKTSNVDLRPLHRILFGRMGSVNEIKRNVRKFSGFSFEKDTPDYDRKKAILEKSTSPVLKRLCDILDLERGGTKEDMVTRVMVFLLCPKDSGKSVKTKKKASKGKAKSSDKKPKNNKTQKAKKDSSEDEPLSESEEASDQADDDDDDESDHDSKKKSKNASKAKKTPKAVTKKSEKKEKPKKEEKKSAKGAKRKRDADDSEESPEEQPAPKKSKMPSDEEIKKLVKRILDAADLQEITMKKVIKQVSDEYPDCDLSHKKAFIKTTIKSVIS